MSFFKSYPRIRLEPLVALAEHKGYNDIDLRRLQKQVEKKKSVIIKAWKTHKAKGHQR